MSSVNMVLMQEKVRARRIESLETECVKKHASILRKAGHKQSVTFRLCRAHLAHGIVSSLAFCLPYGRGWSRATPPFRWDFSAHPR